MRASRPIVLLLALAIIGCASRPEYAPFTGIPRGAAIEVESFEGVTDSGPPASKVGERAFEGGGMGAAVGAQAGLEMGLGSFDGCGEFIVVCIGMVPVMGAIGLVGGVIVGGVVGAVEDLPYQRTEAMQNVISGYFEEAPPNRVFSEKFVEMASSDWHIDESATNRVTVAVIAVRPRKASGKALVFEVTTAMTVDYGAGYPGTTKPYQFTEATSAYEMNEWIDGGQALYASEMEAAYTEAATVFTAILKSPPRKRNR